MEQFDARRQRLRNIDVVLNDWTPTAVATDVFGNDLTPMPVAIIEQLLQSGEQGRPQDFCQGRVFSKLRWGAHIPINFRVLNSVTTIDKNI